MSAKRRMTSSFSSPGRRPCRTPSRIPPARASARVRASDRTAAAGAASASVSAGSSTARPRQRLGVRVVVVPPIRGQTTNTRCPAATSSRTRCQTRAMWTGCSRATTTWVEIGARPAGSSDSVETSTSPKTVIATVRGIGVAVMTRTCGREPSRDFAARAARCSTPKRCCSSTTTSARSWKSTFSWISACVPMTMPASPLTMSSRRLAPVGACAASRSAARRRVASSGDPSRPPSASGPSSVVMDR